MEYDEYLRDKAIIDEETEKMEKRSGVSRTALDLAWKILCNTDYSFAPYFISRLTGLDATKYKVAYESDETEVIRPAYHRYADSAIKTTVDEVHGYIHLEFQSYYSRDVGIRTFEADLSRGIMVDEERATELGIPRDTGNESWEVPDSYVVNVKQYGTGLQELNLRIISRRGTLLITYPVVHAREKIEELDGLMSPIDTAESVNALDSLLAKIPEPANSTEKTMLRYALALLSKKDDSTSVFFDIKELINAMKFYDREFLSVQESAEAKGKANLKALLQEIRDANPGITLEAALKKLNDEEPGSRQDSGSPSKPKGAKEMHLPD